MRPYLEILEGRTLLATCLVNRLGDFGAGDGLEGDFRYCLNISNTNGESSNRIEFAPDLSGKISLTQGELRILKNLEIDGPGASIMSISGGLRSGVFHIPMEAGPVVVSIDDVTITEGIGAQEKPWREGGGLLNGQ
jgi:hypothetical protein